MLKGKLGIKLNSNKDKTGNRLFSLICQIQMDLKMLCVQGKHQEHYLLVLISIL